MWIRSLLDELHVHLSSQIALLWCDNLSASSQASNPVIHTRTKDIDVDVHYIRDLVINKALVVHYVPTKEQLDDMFTKAWSEIHVHTLCIRLRLCDEEVRPAHGACEDE